MKNSTSSSESFYWYDFETFGAIPAKDKPCQFAGIRTDSDFNIIGEPLVIYSKPTNDLLPQPIACLITGITPQIAYQNGLSEVEFCQKIIDEVAKPATCSVGYNSIRFDSEVLRYMFFRNFHDPYAHEYMSKNSRWDLLDVMRAAHALRPDGINWVKHTEGDMAGKPSFKLEHLSVANGIEHEDAHDALADVVATIELAKKLKAAQPKLIEYALTLRNKNTVKDLVAKNMMQPLVHVSGKIPADLACTTLVAPITYNKANNNALISYDLRYSPALLASLSVAEIQERLYTPISELPEATDRVHLKGIHVNKSPFVAPIQTLSAEAQSRCSIDIEECKRHLEELKAIPNLSQKMQDVFDSAPMSQSDAEQNLYGSFIPNEDKNLCKQVRQSSEAQLTELSLPFKDPRLHTLLFRYKARNFPNTLNEDEIEQWEEYRQNKLLHPDGGGSITLDEFETEIQNFAEQYQDDENKMQILEDLSEYAASLM